MDVAEFATAFTPLRVLGGSATKEPCEEDTCNWREVRHCGRPGSSRGGLSGRHYKDGGVGDEVKLTLDEEAMTIGGILVWVWVALEASTQP